MDGLAFGEIEEADSVNKDGPVIFSLFALPLTNVINNAPEFCGTKKLTDDLQIKKLQKICNSVHIF
ncbi:MAG: hypothetical protein KZQ89_12415 [Candidatus Thiodiazotropha sp. (ex Lucinoma kastoroae)]|nr:hypothetical protein [Candidatus Thiodiazotropha sp. (ex Lucinoma kastoroae)]